MSSGRGGQRSARRVGGALLAAAAAAAGVAGPASAPGARAIGDRGGRRAAGGGAGGQNPGVRGAAVAQLAGAAGAARRPGGPSQPLWGSSRAPGAPAQLGSRRDARAPHPGRVGRLHTGPRTCVTVPSAVSAAAAGSAANLLTCCRAAGSAAAAAAVWTGTSPFERAASMMAKLEWALAGRQAFGLRAGLLGQAGACRSSQGSHCGPTALHRHRWARINGMARHRPPSSADGAARSKGFEQWWRPGLPSGSPATSLAATSGGSGVQAGSTPLLCRRSVATAGCMCMTPNSPFLVCA